MFSTLWQKKKKKSLHISRQAALTSEQQNVLEKAVLIYLIGLATLVALNISWIGTLNMLPTVSITCIFVHLKYLKGSVAWWEQAVITCPSLYIARTITVVSRCEDFCCADFSNIL